jgi:hypothetical protein
MDNATTSFTIILSAVSIRPSAEGLVCTFQKLTSKDLLVLISKSVAAANALVKKEVKGKEIKDFSESFEKVETPLGTLITKKPGECIKCDKKGNPIG